MVTWGVTAYHTIYPFSTTDFCALFDGDRIARCFYLEGCQAVGLATAYLWTWSFSSMGGARLRNFAMVDTEGSMRAKLEHAVGNVLHGNA